MATNPIIFAISAAVAAALFAGWALCLLLANRRLTRRVHRSEGAMLRLFTTLRSTEGDPIERYKAIHVVRKVVDEWFDVTMLGRPCTRERSFNPNRSSSMEEEGATFDGAMQERRDAAE